MANLLKKLAHEIRRLFKYMFYSNKKQMIKFNALHLVFFLCSVVCFYDLNASWVRRSRPLTLVVLHVCGLSYLVLQLADVFDLMDYQPRPRHNQLADSVVEAGAGVVVVAKKVEVEAFHFVEHVEEQVDLALKEGQPS